MPVVRAFYQDAFSPVLLSSPPLAVTVEQRLLIRKILDTACSDSRFAEKAYIALERVLTGGSVKVQTITSLNPASVVLGSPNFTLRVVGTNFTPESKIVFNGSEEVTTFVSAQEVTTGVDMSTAVVPISVPVAVQSVEGLLSNTMTFTFNPVARSVSGPSVPSGPSVTPPVVKPTTPEVKR